MESDKKYRIRYTFIEPEFSEKGFTKEDAGKNQGLCDAFAFVSILETNDKWTSTLWAGRDGRGGAKDISDLEMFKAWTGLAKELSEAKDLTDWQKGIALDAFETVRLAILAGRDMKGKKYDS